MAIAAGPREVRTSRITMVLKWLPAVVLLLLGKPLAHAEALPSSENVNSSSQKTSVDGSSQIKRLTAEEAEQLICKDTEKRTFDRVVRYAICRTVSENGVSICKAEMKERTISIEVEGAILDLNALESLPEEVAKVLARHNGILDLNGLKALSDNAASELVSQNGSLNLSGLETISHKTADALNRHSGPVSLIGLKELSAAGYETLRTRRNIRLPNTLTITQVSDGVIVWKQEHPGSFKQYATQLADRFEVELKVDKQAFDKYGLSMDRLLPPPPLAVMNLGSAGNWLADELSQHCPVEFTAGWGKESLHFSTPENSTKKQ